MGDLLIRGLDQALKIELQNSARRNGRSLSDEAIAHIRAALLDKQSSGHRAGERLRAVLGHERFDERDLNAIAAFRKQSDRDPPNFS